ncbi:peptidase T4 [Epibacterium sp. SM1979]|uniref:Peptidase T4 n=1 Tax=Tritonibacter litoralis TaxID=2662264 RepID=A0A843YGX5_9RHOB|nr:P1 family peptidase [Tritonibacter litoralis]MQQ08542.1 peptidase T4 [Tritonibacter litoralis]
MQPGPRNLITDVPGLQVGNAKNPALKSGTTVLIGAEPFTAAVHVMGGAPGTRETDLLAPDKSVAKVDALVLSGGSAFGLDACSGVSEGLRAQGRGFTLGPAIIPIVPGAILFDLLNGGDKSWTTNPYLELGRAALAAAAPEFALGSHGAGTGATTASLKGGLGSASLVLDNGVTVAALVAANPMGSVTTAGTHHFWAAPFEIEDEFGGLGPDPRAGLGRDLDSAKLRAMRKIMGSPDAALGERANTTIAIVATDADLTKAQSQRLAIAAHDGIGRAVVPAHTPMDGDLVFAVSTNTNDSSDGEAILPDLCHAAALCLSRAIARGIYHAQPEDDDLLPCWQENAAGR